MFYPIFAMWYVSRALRLIILFKRAEKGLYFQDKVNDEDENTSTMAILRNSNEDSDNGNSFRMSVIQKPKSK